LGLNMLNFHRAIGQPIVLDYADELGLLYYEEPGGYVTGDDTPFAKRLAREKLLRMVKRDRSHPSLIIYNMINEAWDSHGAGDNPKVMEGHVTDMADAHALDPSRTIVHTSAWAKAKDVEDPAKYHMLPFDMNLHKNGWYDVHHAGGPEVWNGRMYVNPTKYHNYVENPGEFVYWGEEGAISSPPRLELIKADLEKAPQLGWDGQMYLDWYKTFDEFLTTKNLRGSFPAVDSLTLALGKVSYDHQGRRIENMRITNDADGYAVNGWEAEIIENHSGIVDCFRNPKGDPKIIARYNQPLYVAVKVRNQVVGFPAQTTADFFIVNEKNLNGAYTLRVRAKDPKGVVATETTHTVKIIGGDVFAQNLSPEQTFKLDTAPGMWRIEAALLDKNNTEVASGYEEVFSADWKSPAITGNGAIWEGGNRVSKFLSAQKGVQLPSYSDDAGKLDWVIVARPPNEGGTDLIPADRFVSADGKKKGLQTKFYIGKKYSEFAHERVDSTIDFAVDDGANPDPAVHTTEQYDVEWTGTLVPPVTGTYTLHVQSTGGVNLVIGNQQLVRNLADKGDNLYMVKTDLKANTPVPITVRLRHQKGNAKARLLWAPPEQNPPDVAKLMDRVKNDGTTLLIVDRADTWTDVISQNTNAKFTGSFKIGTTWLGGSHFAKSHPLFKDLPTDQALSWPYQSVVREGKNRYGIEMTGEELVAGAWHSYPMHLGTAVGVIPCGKGKIVFSTLDICATLNGSDESAAVARKLLCNFIEYGSAK